MNFEEYFNPINIDELGLVADEKQIRLGQTILTFCPNQISLH